MSKQWTFQSPGTQPPARRGGSMAYDAERDLTLLFGGGGFNDTWTWDGAIWTQLYPSQVPPPRTSACMTYDSQRKNIILFGGVSTAGLPLSDTWLWDGTTWTQLQSPRSPTARVGAVMAYAETQQAAVLFGGESLGKRVGFLLNDTWLWNGTQWNQLPLSSAPPARVGATMAYDAANQQLVLFGGTTGIGAYSDTWLWNGQVWQQRFPATNPTARSWATMVYASALQQVILIGGSSITTNPALSGLHDVWLWNGTTWSQLSDVSTPAGGYHSAAYDDTQQALVLYASTSGKLYPPDKQGHSSQINMNAAPVLQGETWIWHVG